MRKTLNTIAILHVFISILIACVLLSVNDMNYYHQQFVKDETADELGMSQTDVDQAMSVVMQYLRNDRVDMSVTLTIDGEVQEMFNAREKEHMVDVKNLYQGAQTVAYFGFVSLAVIILNLYLDRRRKQATFLFSLAQAGIILGVVMGFVIIFALVDFDGFWVTFHQIFFRNDLWLLNPYTDRMIVMLTDTLFNGLVMKIVINFGLTLIVLAAGLFTAMKVEKKYVAHRLV